MKKRIGRIVAIVIAALLVSLLVWLFWPCSISCFAPVDLNELTDFSSYAMVRDFVEGQSHTDTYRIDVHEMPDEAPGELAEILKTSRYQQDFRNLWPWGVDSVGSDKNYDGRSVTLSFFFRNAENEYTEIQFMTGSLIIVRTENHPGMRVYHPTNPETLDKLVEYFKTHGEKQ